MRPTFDTDHQPCDKSLDSKRRGVVNGSYKAPTNADTSTVDDDPTTALLSTQQPPPPPSIREVLTPRVRVAILNNGTFALVRRPQAPH